MIQPRACPSEMVQGATVVCLMGDPGPECLRRMREVGLGKTVQALAFLSVEKGADRLDWPALTVAPTSLLGDRSRFTVDSCRSIESAGTRSAPACWRGACGRF